MSIRARALRAHPNLAACGFLFALAVAFFIPILLGRTFSTVAGRHVSVWPWRAFDPVFPDYPQNDQADLSYPWQIFIASSLRSGEFPLWNPYSFGGQPFFANGSSAVLYPPKLVAALLLSPSWAHDALSIFHVLLAGVGMWLFLRELEFRVAPALLGATAWMFCPFNMAWVQLEVVAPAAAWLPVGCFLVHRAIERESWPSTIGACAAMACALVSGHLLFMALVYGVVVLYGAALTASRLFRDSRLAARRLEASRLAARGSRLKFATALVRLAVVTVGPLMLAAVVLLPTIIFLRGLGRQPLPYDLAHERIRVPYRVFAHLLWPPAASPVTELEMHQMAYVGRIVALLAAVGFFSARRGAWFGRLLAAVTFLVATDTIVLRWIYAVFPQFSFFSPLGRLLNFFAFGVIILGAAGLDTLMNARLQSLHARLEPSRSRVMAAAALVAFTAVELVVYARKVNPEFPPREERFSFPRTPLIRRLAAELGAGNNGPGRFIPIRRTPTEYSPPILSANEAMVFGFESAAGWDSTLPNRAETLWRIVGGEPVDAAVAATYRRAFWASFDVSGTRLDVLPRTGVTTIVGAPELPDEPLWEQRRRTTTLKLQPIYAGIDGLIYRIDGARGGPFVAGRPAYVDTSRAALDWILNPPSDSRDEAVLESADVPASWRSHGAADSKGSARVLSKTANSEEIQVDATGDAWVVLPNNWDSGWSAELDGEAVPVLRANYTFQAVPVSAGHKRLRLSYRPRGLTAGAVVSTCAVALLIVGAARRWPAGKTDVVEARS